MGSRAAMREVILKPKAPPAALLQAGAAVRQVLPSGEGHLTLFEDKITVRDTTMDEELPRRYTLVHDDRTSERLLSIGRDYDQELLERPQVREARDEVRAELIDGDPPRLLVSCLIAGEGLGVRYGDPATRRRSFERELPLALAVLRYGDRFYYERHPERDRAPVLIQFRSSDPQHADETDYGRITDYRVTRIAGESRRLMVGAAALATLGIGALVVGKLRKREP
jgi:hypothetical protein